MTPCSCNKKKDPIEKKCPLCKKSSKSIHYTAVKPVVKEELQKFIYKEQYYICSNQDCDVVFFNEEGDFIFLTRDINMAADFYEVSKAGVDSCKGQCKGCGHSEGG